MCVRVFEVCESPITRHNPNTSWIPHALSTDLSRVHTIHWRRKGQPLTLIKASLISLSASLSLAFSFTFVHVALNLAVTQWHPKTHLIMLDGSLMPRRSSVFIQKYVWTSSKGCVKSYYVIIMKISKWPILSWWTKKKKKVWLVSKPLLADAVTTPSGSKNHLFPLTDFQN